MNLKEEKERKDGKHGEELIRNFAMIHIKSIYTINQKKVFYKQRTPDSSCSLANISEKQLGARAYDRFIEKKKTLLNESRFPVFGGIF